MSNTKVTTTSGRGLAFARAIRPEGPNEDPTSQACSKPEVVCEISDKYARVIVVAMGATDHTAIGYGRSTEDR